MEAFVVVDGSGICLEDDTHALGDLIGLRPDTGVWLGAQRSIAFCLLRRGMLTLRGSDGRRH